MNDTMTIQAYIQAHGVTRCHTRLARGYKGQRSHSTKAPRALLNIWKPAKDTTPAPIRPVQVYLLRNQIDEMLDMHPETAQEWAIICLLESRLARTVNGTL